ncbi:phosphatase PAP2 family protein [Marinobacterium litorale]|uniref:phosphatase PAP2 family protein n=1 Tax=Marinobacterium litorale TaxID=404770 RepID=UPI0004286DBB|nr:phosphatase PAP2 family protein [Marinobacterium litorale]
MPRALSKRVSPAPIYLPLIVAIGAQLLISALNLDRLLADTLFSLEGKQWLLRDHWLFSEVLHTGGRRISEAFLGLICLAWLSSAYIKGLRPWRRALGYLVFAPLTATLLVSSLKQLTGVECPWNLSVYGGDQPYIPLLQALFQYGDGACFPAGHASAGYAWVALYFAALELKPVWKWRCLGGALLLGVLFGVTQQLRGAHFLSHDLWSLIICWYASALLARVMLCRRIETGEQRSANGFQLVKQTESTGGR